jgi:cytochrome c oxidase cbb3-type subunit 3
VKRGNTAVGVIVGGALLGCFCVAGMQISAQTPTPAPAAVRPLKYPDRQKAPQEVLDRGKATYGVNCAFCHGSDAGGGEVGPNLLRSGVVLEDQNGELITPIVHGGRVNQGMPRVDISDAQIADIAAWIHSIRVFSGEQLPEVPINIVTGDAAAGKVYFQKTCASCHSATGDLKDIGTIIPNPKILQQTWLLPGGGGGRSGAPNAPPGVHVSPTTVTVSLPGGEKVDGELLRIDEFYVGLRLPDGSERSFRRVGDLPKVEIHDKLAPHRELITKYTDKDIHNITAYLVTLK